MKTNETRLVLQVENVTVISTIILLKFPLILTVPNRPRWIPAESPRKRTRFEFYDKYIKPCVFPALFLQELLQLNDNKINELKTAKDEHDGQLVECQEELKKKNKVIFLSTWIT